MILNLQPKKYNIPISFSSNKEKETPYEKFKKEDPDFLTHDLPATCSATLISVGHFLLSEFTYRRTSFIGIPVLACLIGASFGLDNFVGKQLKEKYKNDEEKRKKLQLTYDIGIATTIAPIAFSLMDKFKKPTKLMLKIAKEKKTDAYKSWICKESLIGTVILGGTCGLFSSLNNLKINNWASKNVYGADKFSKNTQNQ